MVHVHAHRPVAPAVAAEVRVLSDAAAARDGHPSLGDDVWRDLDAPDARTVVLVAEAAGHAVGALHLARRPDGGATAAIVVHPDHREAGIATRLVHEALQTLASDGGGHLTLWAFGADERAEALATSAGFTRERELWQMRVALPLGEDVRWPEAIAVRPFEPGRDDAEWVAVNNRAFAADPDQGGWTESTLRRRQAEPWFDPRGFLLAIDRDEIVGFCWTKVHPAAPPTEPVALGEIYVIGVDPAHQGTGLGRALVVAGLASLSERGVPVGMLFVDASNAPAVGLYEALGFQVARIDRAYGQDVR